MRKIGKMLMVLCLALVLTVAGSFATCAVSGTAGQTVTVKFPFRGLYGMDGYLTFDNLGMFQSVKLGKKVLTASSDISGSFSCTADAASVFNLAKQVPSLPEPGAQAAVMLYGASVATDFDVILTCVIKKDIPAGTRCGITLKYENNVTADGDMDDNGGQWYYTAQVVNVGESTPSDAGGRVGVDYTELKKQLSVADTLVAGDYSADSWTVLAVAVEKAKTAKAKGTQEEVNAATVELKLAIEQLAAVDYTKLQTAITETENYSGSTPVGKEWSEMLDALEAGKAMTQSRDQASVDAAADRLNQALNAVQDELAALQTPSGGKENAIDTNTPFCNLPTHKLWPILLIVCAALDVGFVLLILWYMRRRKVESAADVPLVDYSIEDDDELFKGIEFPTAPAPAVTLPESAQSAPEPPEVAVETDEPPEEAAEPETDPAPAEEIPNSDD